MTGVLLDVQDLDISYRLPGGRHLQAVSGVSFTVDRGQVAGLVGESGCGKSSVVRSVVGLQQPAGGQVCFDGTDIWETSRKNWKDNIAARIGVVFQDPTSSLNPRLTIRELLTDPMRIHGVGTKAERELSGGQRQRVAIARAVALRPALLVADEPTSALDVSIRNQILNLLLELRDELGLAMLVISHDITAITYLSDVIGVMYLGRIVETGTATAVHDNFEHPYTATLLSARPTLASGEPATSETATRPADSGADQAPGCPFVPRCWRSTPECSAEFPPDSGPGAGHIVHCLHPLGQPQTASAPGQGATSRRKRDGDPGSR
jgi:peptide/nickel transport system ATP-binding protein